jgi:hypothetical protein
VPLLKPPERPAPTHYDVDGVRYPRVSQIVGILDKPGLARWYGKHGNEKAEQLSKTARDFGTRLHKALEEWSTFSAFEWNSQGRDDLYRDLMPWIEAYDAWWTRNVARIVVAEHQVVSRGHGFAGTLDLIAELLNGDLGVVDFKSTEAKHAGTVWPAYRLQTSAYRLAAAEEGIVCQQRIVLNFVKDRAGELRSHDLDRHREDTAAFLACLEVYKWLQN